MPFFILYVLGEFLYEPFLIRIAQVLSYQRFRVPESEVHDLVLYFTPGALGLEHYRLPGFLSYGFRSRIGLPQQFRPRGLPLLVESILQVVNLGLDCLKLPRILVILRFRFPYDLLRRIDLVTDRPAPFNEEILYRRLEEVDEHTQKNYKIDGMFHYEPPVKCAVFRGPREDEINYSVFVHTPASLPNTLAAISFDSS